MPLQVFTEMQTGQARIVKESEGSGVFRFEALLSEAGHINRNKRMYPKPVLERALEEFKNSIKQRPGAVDHPDPFVPPSLSDNGILWEDAWWDPMKPNELWGRGKIIPTQKGKDLQANIEAGVDVGFSTRGRGRGEERQLSEGTFTEMVEYELDTIDAVTDPSVFHARAKTFTKENVEMAQENVAEFAKTVGDLSERAVKAETEASRLKAALEAADTKAKADRDALAAEQTKAVEDLKAKYEAVEKELNELKAAKQADTVEAHLIGLTQDSTFGAGIRAKIDEMRKLGLVVTMDNAQSLVDTWKPAIEALAASGNYQIPAVAGKGTIPADEDKAPTNEKADWAKLYGYEPTDAEIAAARASGLY